MIIRCPNCEYSRTINITAIPQTAELATCPKCKHRFRFRTISTDLDEEEAARRDAPAPPPPPRSAKNSQTTPSGSQGLDIWDAVDALNQQWERQMEQHVTEVITPVPQTMEEQPQAAIDQTRPLVVASHPKAAERDTPQSDVEEYTAPLPEAENNAKMQVASEEQGDTDAHADPAVHHAPEDSASALSPRTTQTVAAPAYTEQAEVSAVFPYANDETSPEERVERDILLLRDSGERPLRDLGRLDEYGSAGSDEQGGDKGADGDIPWEMPEKYGWLQAFIKTIHEVMFNAPSFFSRLRPSSSLASEYLFFLLLGYIAILGSVVWTRIALFLIPSLREDTSAGLNLPVMLLLAPLALGLMQICVTGGIRIIQRLFSSEQPDFSLVFKIVTYAVAPFVLSVVPFVGPIVGAIWFLATLFIGCRHALGFPWQRAVAVPLFPALVLIYGVVWYFL